MNEIGIGLLGFGTVGAGVVEALQRNGDLLTQRAGVRLVVRKIADLDLTRDRGVQVDPAILTSDAAAAIADPSVHVVVELIGGVGLARQLTLQALALGKPVITANKALLAEHGEELFRAAAEHGTDLFFEASVGGGIPIIRALREGLPINRMDGLVGILNGTCNYILTRMEKEGLPFDQVLSEAQAAGYAEAEPSLDIDGLDTAHKAVVLATQAYGRTVSMDEVHVEGIRGMDPVDIQYAAELGYRIKLLAVIKQSDKGLDLRVHPALVPHDHLLASVHGVFNAVMIEGDLVGDTLYYGRGAGRLPTASAVVGDLVDAARNLTLGCAGRVPAFVSLSPAPQIQPAETVETRYYMRMSLKDEPGVFGRVAQILGRHHISLASVVQKEKSKGAHVPVVMLTHQATEGRFRAALKELDALAEVGAPTLRYRMEDFDVA